MVYSGDSKHRGWYKVEHAKHCLIYFLDANNNFIEQIFQINFLTMFVFIFTVDRMIFLRQNCMLGKTFQLFQYNFKSLI